MTYDDITPLSCPACAGPVERESCWVCQRSGVVTIAAYDAWKRDRERRLSGQFDNFRAVLEYTLQLLDKRATVAAKIIARDGRQLIETLDECAMLPLGHEDRSKALRDVFDFQKRALSFLNGDR